MDMFDAMLAGLVTLLVPQTLSFIALGVVYGLIIGILPELGAKAIRVEHHRGAGGLLGANLIWAAKPDGLTFGLTSGPTLLLAQLAGADGVKFNATKFTYLGRPTADDRVIFVASGSSIKSFKDVIALKRPFKVPSQGVDDDFYATAVLAEAFGFKVHFITGYEGAGDTNLSIMRGDTDERMTSWPSARSIPRSKTLRDIEQNHKSYQSILHLEQ